MPETATAPQSLSDILTAATTANAAAAAPPAATPPAASPPVETTPPADDTSQVAATDDATAAAAPDTGTAVATDATATDGAAAATDTAADTGAAAAAVAAIDWGAAMPALKARAQELLGDEAGAVTRLEDIDGIIKTMAGQAKLIGQQSQYVNAVNYLGQQGVTVDMLRALANKDMATLQSLLVAAGAAVAPAAAVNGHGAPAWSKDLLLGLDNEGKPVFNKAKLAEKGMTEAQAIAARDGWNSRLAEIFSGPESIEEYIGKMIEGRVAPAAERTKQELTQAQQQAEQQRYAQQAQAAYAAETTAWAKANAKLLYANKADVSGGATKFYQDMETMMGQLNLGPAPTVQQLEAVKNAVLAMNRPAAPPAATPSDKTKRLPATNGSAAKLTPAEFHKKYGDRYDGLGMAEWFNYESTGKVPEVARR